MFNSKRPRSGLPEWDGQQFAFDDPRIPLPIRQSLARLAQADDRLYFADTDTGGEWWLLDEAENLIESFCLRD
ncbi:hypothetical protein ACLIKD_10690 [Azonexus sp. IMCC34842]|uniref:hypothetical protein n=1 Tax=Azonexus sp. IMCC34842 TaxID=3420950 RepID=UPI003D0B026B